MKINKTNQKKLIKLFLLAASLFMMWLICFIFQGIPATVCAQSAPADKNAGAVKTPSVPKKQPIEITGDLFEMEKDGTYVVSGNVHVYQGKREIICDRGTYNEKTGIVRAFTNVRILDEKFNMKCQRVDSHMKENYTLFSGGVVVEGNNFIATAERSFYYEKEEKAILIGNPVAKSLHKSPNEVHGERIIYYLKTERTEVVNNVTAIMQPRENEKNGTITHISGNRLEVLADGRYQVTDNLRVLKKDMILYADRGIYDETSEVTEAFGNVKVDTSKYTLTSGYVKHVAKEDRTIANIKPKLIQIVDKKKRLLPSEEKKSEEESEENKADGGEKSPDTEKSQDGEKSNAVKENGDTSETSTKKKISNKDKIILEANEIEALEDSTHLIAKGNASLIQFPYIGQEGTEGVEINSKVESQIMDIFTDEGKMVAKQDVVLTSKDITAYGDTATYYEKEDRLDIEGNAHAIQRRGKGLEDNDIVGKKITYYASTERILIKEPIIKFFQTSKEEKALPEIEKDSGPVRIKRKKSSSTAEVGLSKTAEVSLDKTAEVGLTGSSEVKINQTGTNETSLTGKDDQPADRKRRAANAKQTPQPNVRIKINPDSGKVSDVKVKDK